MIYIKKCYYNIKFRRELGHDRFNINDNKNNELCNIVKHNSDVTS